MTSLAFDVNDAFDLHMDILTFILVLILCVPGSLVTVVGYLVTEASVTMTIID